MAIAALTLQDLKLDSLSPEDQAVLNALILEFLTKLNEMIAVMNTNHP